LKSLLIFAFCCLFFFHLQALVYGAAENTQEASVPPSNALSRRLEAAIEARKSGDPGAISSASGQVVALGLAQMAKLRLDQKAYKEAAELCQHSLEFEDTAKTHADLAIINLYAGRPSEAAKQATIAADMDPQSALAWTIKGEALLRTKDYAGAVSALSRSTEIMEDAEPLYSLGIAQLGMGEKQAASESFSRMLALVADSGWSRLLIGRAYQQQNLPQQAITEFQNALRLDPRTANAHYFWAWTLLQASSWSLTPEARSHLQEELKLNPRHFLAIYLLGIFESMERNYDESDRFLRLAAELRPSLPDVWMYIGLNENGRNANRSAEGYLHKAIILAERSSPKEHLSIRQAYFVLGRILLSSGRKKEGADLIKKGQELQDLTDSLGKAAIENSPDGKSSTGRIEPYIPETDDRNPFSVGSRRTPSNDLDAQGKDRQTSRSLRDSGGRGEKQLRTLLGSSFNDLATAEALQEKYDLAVNHYREASNWDPRIPGLQRNLGLAAYYAGEPAEAIRVLSKVVAAKPADTQARSVLGLAYFAKLNFSKAVQTIRPIANQALESPQLGFAWVKSLVKTGNRNGAIRALQNLERANTNPNVDTLIQFGQLWQELGDSNHAAEFFRRALLIDPENAEAKCALYLSKRP
jgi:tetratricopeptide (TPR) repeat protein